MTAREPWDVIVVGGGPAGLSAALMLGRCRRRVLVCDSGPKRNRASHALHGFLTRDGTAPAELLRVARVQLRRYPTVERREARVTGLRRRGRLFEATLARGRRVAARRVLLATGVVDELPDWPTLKRFYGRSVFHCPYCDGWEFRDRGLAAWGRTSATAGLALKLTSWSRRVTLLTDAAYRLAPSLRARLRQRGVLVREEPVVRLAGRSGALEHVVLADGAPVACDALFLTVPCRQACDLFRPLGCRLTGAGAIRADRKSRTHAPGVFAAGDASVDSQLVVVAASEGARAAIAIHEELLDEELRTESRSSP
ncbi:MAG TPA: NAD(P)/FAD-dependent oxidoreductase [Vicinamibacteria bacterium]|nr:NAD(P)/FAD-dependent oxidoreductase [Vicinamibacteria bacterium]